MKIILSLIFLLIYSYSYSNNDSGLFKALQNQITQNSNSIIEKDYFLWVDMNGQSLDEQSLVQGDAWIEENIPGLIPAKTKIEEQLNIFNDKPSQKINYQKVQHYVMVVDVSPAMFTRLGPGDGDHHYTGYQFGSHFGVIPEIDDKVTYNAALELKINNAINGFKEEFNEDGISIRDPNANLYISIFVINRQIKGGVVRELKFTYEDIFRDVSGGTFENVLNTELKTEIDKLQKNGFNFLNYVVQKHVEVFHGITEDLFPPCENGGATSMGYVSDLGYDFYDHYCTNTEFDLNEPLFREVVIRTSWFLDFAHTYTGIIGPAYFNGSLMELDLMLKFFVESYYNSGMNDKFAIYFKNNYRTLFNTYKEDTNYTLKEFDAFYVELFFNPEDLIGAELYNRVKTEFHAISINGPTASQFIYGQLSVYFEYETPAGAERVTKRFHNLVKGATSSELYTGDDLDDIYNLIISNEQVLWDFYLDPAGPGVPGYGGAKVTKIAEDIGKFLFNEDQNGLGIAENDMNSYLKNEGAPQVITAFKKTFTNSTNNTKDFNLLFDISAPYIPPTNGNDSGEFSFTIKTASKYTWTVDTQHKRWYWEPIIDESAYQYSLDDNVEFFAPIGNLQLNTPTYYANCKECKPVLAFEYAFVTATRIRDEALDDKINNAILAVEIISLPFAITEYAAAKGLIRLYRGIVLAVDIETVALSVIGSGSLEDGCAEVFGPVLGAKVLPYLNTMNAVVGGAQLAEIIGPGGIKLMKSFEMTELVDAAASSSYLAKTEEYLGTVNNSIIGHEQYTELRTLRSQLETNLGVNDVPNAPELIDNVEDVFIGFENGVGNSPLRSNEKFEELMIKYQYWKKGESNQSELMQADEFLKVDDAVLGSGLSPEERNILDAMLTDELGDLITGAFKEGEALKNSHKLKALKKLAKNNVCQL